MNPYVICHMCTTIDGKILTARWGKIPGPKSSASLFESTADSLAISAWIVGTTTMKEFSGKPGPLKKETRRVGAEDYVANPKAKRFAIGVDAKAALRFQEGEVDGDHTVVLITHRAGNDYRAALQAAGVSYLVCGKTDVDLPLAMRKLRGTFGIKKLLLEGGGKFNGSMLAAGLVDEISQVVVPVVDGGTGVSGFFDIDGSKKAAATLRQMSHKKLPGGANWFRYKIVRMK